MTDNGYRDVTSEAFGGAANVEEPELPRVSTPEEAKGMAVGSKFLDPQNNVRVVPYRPDTVEDISSLPEGSHFVDPRDRTTLRMKPKYEGVSYTAQMLHDMAPDAETKRKALEMFYPGKVKAAGDELIIADENGVYRKPDGRGLAGGLGRQTSEIGPVLGMAVGGLLGAGGGTAIEPGGGTAAGAFGGMTLGAAAGRQFNNVILGIAGLHQSIPQQISSDVTEATLAATGEVGGTVISKIPGAVKGAANLISAAKEKAGGVREGLSGMLESVGVTPERARYFLGTDLDTAQRAAEITNKGGRVAPSVLAPGAPGLAKTEQFDAVFSGINKFGEAARDYYEKQAKDVLASPEIGANVSLDEMLTRAEKKVSSAEAGQKALAAARHDMAADDAELENAARDAQAKLRKPIVEMGGESAVAESQKDALRRLTAAHERVTKNISTVIDGEIQGLQGELDQALEMSKKGEDPSALLRMIDAKFRAYGASIKSRAKVLYNSADAAAGGALPEISSLVDDADAFLKSLPEGLRAKYPNEIRDLSKLAGTEGDPAKGVAPTPPTQLTFGELHHLRSWFRHGIDYADLTPDMREGALRKFEQKINAVLHDKEAAPELKTAAKLLDDADAFYKEKVPFLNDQMVVATIKSLKSGAGANPEALANILFDPERTEALRRARSIVGENLWKAVQAAHIQQKINDAKIVGSNQIDFSKFAASIEQDLRNGLLTSAYDERTAKTVEKLAADIRRFEGKIPIDAEAGDTISSLLRKGKAASEAIDKFVETDPFKALARASADIDKEWNEAQRMVRVKRQQEPLSFLYQNSMSQLGVKAADKILGNQDLIMAAAQKFGRDSSEFKALQKVYVQRFFQRSLGKTSKMREELGGEKGMTEEVQALMFPGVTRNDMLQLVRDMEFLFSGAADDMGGSMAAASRVLNPWQHVPVPKLGGLSGMMLGVPGMTAVGRFMLGKLFATITDAVSHPNFVNWLAGNLRGSEAQRQMARAVLRQRLRLGGLLGAGMTQTQFGSAAQSDVGEQGESPVAGAKQAPDGHYYIPDPARPGKYLRVDHGPGADASRP
jgi:hypothetical protein